MAGGDRAGRWAVLAVSAFALGGCFSGSSSKMGEVRATVAPSPGAIAALAIGETVRVGPLPASAEASDPPKPNAATAVQVAALPAVQQPQAATRLPPSEGLKRLVGLDRASLESMLGPPWLLRREAAAELWQYRAPNCVLDLFLYAKGDSELRVAHADLRGRRENRPVPAGCFAELVGGAGQKAEAVKG